MVKGNFSIRIKSGFREGVEIEQVACVMGPSLAGWLVGLIRKSAAIERYWPTGPHHHHHVACVITLGGLDFHAVEILIKEALSSRSSVIRRCGFVVAQSTLEIT